MGGTLDGFNTATRLSKFDRWEQQYAQYLPMRSTTIANNGNATIYAPRLIINDERSWHDAALVLTEAIGTPVFSPDKTNLLRLWNFVKDGREHFFPPGMDGYQSYKLLTVYGYGMCDLAEGVCRVLANNANAYSYRMTHHTVAEINSCILDPDVEVFYLGPDNRKLASVEDVTSDTYLIRRTKHFGRNIIYYKGNGYGSDDFISRVYNNGRFLPVKPTAGLQSLKAARSTQSALEQVTYSTFEKGIPMFPELTSRSFPLRLMAQQAGAPAVGEYDFRLRPHERIAYRWDKAEKYYHSWPGTYDMPEVFKEYFISNSKHILSTNFTAPVLSEIFDEVNHMQYGNLPSLPTLIATADSASLSYTVDLPYPILDATVKGIFRCSSAEDSIELFFSHDGRSWSKAWTSAQTGIYEASIALTPQFPYPLPDYTTSPPQRYSLKFVFHPSGTLSACGIDSLYVESTFQIAKRFLPTLRLGTNSISYRDAGGEGARNVEVSVEWQETSSNRPPNKVTAPVFPAQQAAVDSLYFAFTWEAATDDDGDAIADYEFMLSDDARMLYPHSPNFNLYVSCFNEGVKPYFKVKETGWLNDGETYYWRVRAKDVRGAWGEWSDTWSFTPHGVMRPVNGKAEIRGQSIHLTWDRNPTGKQPDFYKIYASNESNGFSPEASNFFALCDSAHLVIPFGKTAAPSSFYRVAACDAQGQESLISDVIGIPYPYIYSAIDKVGTAKDDGGGVNFVTGGGHLVNFNLIANSRYYPYYHYGYDTIYYQPDIAILSKPDWVEACGDTMLIPNDMHLARELLYLDSAQRSIMVAMDDYKGGVATQTLVIETAAKNSKPKLALKENAFCTQNAYKGFVTSVDGDVAFGDTNYYTVLQKPSWLSYSIAGDTVRLWGNIEVSTQNDLFIKLLAVDSKNDSTIAAFQINAQQLYILSASTDTAVEDQRYAHQIQFSRLPNEPTFSFVRLPGWLQMDDQYRLVGTPQIHDLSDTLVHFTVSDRQCPVAAEHTLAIHIEHVNHAPVITTARLPLAYEGESYSAQVRAFDVDRLVEDPELRYTLVPSWSWLSIDAQTGMLSGEPLAQHAGDTVFQITVQDKQGERDTKTFTVPFAVLKLSSYTACASKAYEGYIAPTDGEAYRYTVLQKPSWMDYAITGDSIHLRGNANMSASGSDDVTISILAVNSRNDSIAASFSMKILEPLQILSPVADTAAEDQPYAHQIQFNRPPGKLTFSFTRLPGWLQQDGKSRLSGTPRIQHLSDTLVHFTVSDSQCSVEAEYALTIHVAHVNHAPAITTAHLPPAYEGKEYSARVSAADVDSLIEDVGLQYTLIPAWSWLSINPQTGLLSGVPLGEHLGDTVFHFIVQDRQGGSDAKTFSIAVVGDNITGVEKDAAWPGKKLTCQIFQPAAGKLHYAKIQAEEEVVFRCYIYNTAGYLIYASPRQKLGRGVHYLPVDLQHQPADVYIFVGVENGTLQHAIKFVNNH
jgi:hypothetical protein